MSEYRVTDSVEIFSQEGDWVYIPVPPEITGQLSHFANRGLIPVRARINETDWETSLMPMGDGTHFIPLSKKIRKREQIEVGKTITISFRIR